MHTYINVHLFEYLYSDFFSARLDIALLLTNGVNRSSNALSEWPNITWLF